MVFRDQTHVRAVMGIKVKMHFSWVSFVSIYGTVIRMVFFLSCDSYSEKSETLKPDVRVRLLIKTFIRSVAAVVLYVVL